MAEKIQTLIFCNNVILFVLKTYVIFYINPNYIVNKQLPRKKDNEGKTKRKIKKVEKGLKIRRK
jgi:hypothetical protein